MKTFAAAFSALLMSALSCTKPSYATEIKVAFLPCGTINDKSWSEAGYVGVVAAIAAHLGACVPTLPEVGLQSGPVLSGP